MDIDFGRYLKERRLKKGYTINQLALYSGMSSAQLSRIENGKRGIPKAENIQKIASALSVPHEEMMKVAGYMEDEENDLDKKSAIINKITRDFPDAELMFNDLANMSADDMQDVYDYIKFKRSQKE